MESMGKWRKFFEGAEADICRVIDGIILVAGSDCPHQFKKRRDKIMEKLYTSTSHCEHQYKNSWRDVANEEIKSTGNVATAAIAGTSTMQEMSETKMDANHCSKQKIVRQQHMSYEENLHDKLDFNPSSLPSQNPRSNTQFKLLNCKTYHHSNLLGQFRRELKADIKD